MGFEANRQQTFSKRIVDLPDQPNMAASDLKAYFDSSAEELRQSFNALCDALGDLSAAAKMGYRASAGVPAKTVQDAIENVQAQLIKASAAELVSGCVDYDKLAKDVRDRFTAGETLVQTEAKARSQADTVLQENINKNGQILALKAEVAVGQYIGDGQTERRIELGYHPKAVLVFRDGYNMAYGGSIYGGTAVEGIPIKYSDKIALGVTDTGFQVLEYSNCMMNQHTCPYTYIAIH